MTKTTPNKYTFLTGKTALITGGGKRIGAMLVTALADQGTDVIIHYSRSQEEAEILAKACARKGVKADLFPCDFSIPEVVESKSKTLFKDRKIDYLINNASIFESMRVEQTDLVSWQKNININLTAPFILSKHFAMNRTIQNPGRIINILDWRALRPGADHFPYTISKAALASLTKSLAASFAPHTQVNGIAFGAILAPADGTKAETFLINVPSKRLATPDEVIQTVFFLLTGPEYITGEIIHLDGGRHLF